MAAHLQYTYPFALELQGFGQVLLGQCHTLPHSHLRQYLPGLQVMLYFPENPRMPVCGPAYHDAVHTVAVERLPGLLRGVDVPVANYRDVHAGVLLDFPYQGPVGFSGVHLAACPSVYGKCLYARILQTLGELHDDFRVFVPAQAGLYGDWQLHRVHHHAGDLDHLVRFLHHPGPCPAPGYLADRAAEIYVHQVCPVPSRDAGRVFRHPGGVDHCLRDVAVYLDAYRGLVVIGHELGEGLLRVTYQPVG